MECFMLIKDLILAAMLAVSLPFAHAESTEPQAGSAAPAESMAEQQQEE
jgi:type IV secretory pathway VirB2 component (pilin)